MVQEVVEHSDLLICTAALIRIVFELYASKVRDKNLKTYIPYNFYRLFVDKKIQGLKKVRIWAI
jgi:hypothetical protein